MSEERARERERDPYRRPLVNALTEVAPVDVTAGRSRSRARACGIIVSIPFTVVAATWGTGCRGDGTSSRSFVHYLAMERSKGMVDHTTDKSIGGTVRLKFISAPLLAPNEHIYIHIRRHDALLIMMHFKRLCCTIKRKTTPRTCNYAINPLKGHFDFIEIF